MKALKFVTEFYLKNSNVLMKEKGICTRKRKHTFMCMGNKKNDGYNSII